MIPRDRQVYQNSVTHIFWLSIFSDLFVDWEKEWAQCFNFLHLITEVTKSEMNKSENVNIIC